MKNNLSKSDVHALKVLLEKAKNNAEQDILQKFKSTKIENIKDLSKLELKIRKWRKDLEATRSFCYETVENDIKNHLKKGWLTKNDINSLSEERKQKLKL